MMVIICILWVLNMLCAASTTNRIWPLNAFAALCLTVEAARIMS